MNQITTNLNTGARMPLLGLGVYDMHAREAVESVVTALETGYRLIDTASAYGNEREIGEGIRQAGTDRNEIFVTTKVANHDQGYDATLRAFDESERRLGCGYIDLYLVHWPLKATRKETWLALEKLYTEKRVRAIGVANYLPPFLGEMTAYQHIIPAVNQVEFSPYLFLKDLLDICKAKGTILQAYTPLLRGARMSDPKLTSLAAGYGKTPAQMLLRWAVQHGVSTIPKSSNPARIRENFDIFDFEITDADMNRMDSLHENLRVVEDPMLHW